MSVKGLGRLVSLSELRQNSLEVHTASAGLGEARTPLSPEASSSVLDESDSTERQSILGPMHGRRRARQGEAPHWTRAYMATCACIALFAGCSPILLLAASMGVLASLAPITAGAALPGSPCWDAAVGRGAANSGARHCPEPHRGDGAGAGRPARSDGAPDDRPHRERPAPHGSASPSAAANPPLPALAPLGLGARTAGTSPQPVAIEARPAVTNAPAVLASGAPASATLSAARSDATSPPSAASAAAPAKKPSKPKESKSRKTNGSADNASKRSPASGGDAFFYGGVKVGTPGVGRR